MSIAASTRLLRSSRVWIFYTDWVVRERRTEKWEYLMMVASLPHILMKHRNVWRRFYYTFLTCYILGALLSYTRCPGAGATHVKNTSWNNILICIIAASRGNVSYVHPVMQALRDQISVPGVLVDLDDHYAEVQLPDRFVCLVPSDRAKESCNSLEGDIGRPNCVARQQTRDVAVGLRRCTEMAGQHTWVVMLEDDMLPCPNAIRLMSVHLSGLDATMVQTVKFAKFTRAVAFSPGTALFYAQDALASIMHTPSDLVVNGNWGRGSALVYQGGSLFTHIGTVSTNSYRNDISYKEKWKDLRKENCGDLL
jgi:hypothetical protein